MNENYEQTLIFRQFSKGNNYIKSKNVISCAEQYRKFWEGEQWDHGIAKDLDIPEITVPISQSIVGNKTANTLKDETNVEFYTCVGEESSDKDERINRLQMLYETVCNNMDYTTYRRNVVISGAVEMLGILYFYFSADQFHEKKLNSGDIKCEEIGLADFVVENFTLKDIQKQEYIIIRQYVSVDRAKEMYKRNFSNKAGYRKIEECVKETENNSKIDDRVVPIFIKFWRIDGEVYSQIACEYIELSKPTPLNIRKTAKRLEKKIMDEYAVQHLDTEVINEYQTDSGSDVLANTSEEEQDTNNFYLYPVSIYRYKDRKNSIFGQSEMESLMTAQKSINYYTSLVVKNGFDIASPKVVVLPGALNGQTITNEPSQMLIDYTNTGSGYRYLQTDNSLVNAGLVFVTNLTEILRETNAATSIMQGQITGRDLSSETVNTLISQAKAPLDDPINNLRSFDEQSARIIAMFAKFYYENKEFSYKRRAEELTENILAKYNIDKNIDGSDIQPIGERYKSVKFNGSDYNDMDMSVVIKTVQKNSNYVTLLVNTINTMIMNQNFSALPMEMQIAIIDVIPETMLELNDKKVFIQAIVRQQTGIVAQLQQQLQQAIAANEQSAQAYQALQQQYTNDMSKAERALKQLADDNSKLQQTLMQIFANVKRNSVPKDTSPE